jgi:hypothetical protein
VGPLGSRGVPLPGRRRRSCVCFFESASKISASSPVRKSSRSAIRLAASITLASLVRSSSARSSSILFSGSSTTLSRTSCSAVGPDSSAVLIRFSARRRELAALFAWSRVRAVRRPVDDTDGRADSCGDLVEAVAPPPPAPATTAPPPRGRSLPGTSQASAKSSAASSTNTSELPESPGHSQRHNFGTPQVPLHAVPAATSPARRGATLPAAVAGTLRSGHRGGTVQRALMGLLAGIAASSPVLAAAAHGPLVFAAAAACALSAGTLGALACGPFKKVRTCPINLVRIAHSPREPVAH